MRRGASCAVGPSVTDGEGASTASSPRLTLSEKYMHLSPSAVADAIRLLDGSSERGDIVETATSLIRKWLCER